MRHQKLARAMCASCGKSDTVGFNRPNSLHKTKRVFKPNLQYYKDVDSGVRILICTRCLRTFIKKPA